MTDMDAISAENNGISRKNSGNRTFARADNRFSIREDPIVDFANSDPIHWKQRSDLRTLSRSCQIIGLRFALRSQFPRQTQIVNSTNQIQRFLSAEELVAGRIGSRRPKSASQFRLRIADRSHWFGLDYAQRNPASLIQIWIKSVCSCSENGFTGTDSVLGFSIPRCFRWKCQLRRTRAISSWIDGCETILRLLPDSPNIADGLELSLQVLPLLS
jgi:hypothetical protein